MKRCEHSAKRPNMKDEKELPHAQYLEDCIRKHIQLPLR